MLSLFKRLIIGKALRSDQIEGEKFNVFWGLPILSSDAISSVAYAGEEILYVLVPVLGILAYKEMFHVALVIVGLLCILTFSYRQTIDAYPNGGGSYIVAHDNLGTIPGLTAAAALSIDYVLTVAVSLSAGTAAITSAFPSLLDHKVAITLFFLVAMTIGNLRGIRESSRIFGLPTYLFFVSMFALIVYGLAKVWLWGYVPVAKTAIPDISGELTLLLLLKAFSGGCTALTGVEAVSNGIPNFKQPAQPRAKFVLLLLCLVALCMFGGTSYLATIYHAVPNPDETIIAQIASQVFGDGIMFYLVQFSTALILVLAANTAYTDFPLLLSILAKDGFAPRQFSRRGDRLSFSNGIELLALLAGLLVIVFEGETHLLLPLYAVGVFASFTLSQSGMLVHWLRLKVPGWRHRAVINGIGAFMTFVTVLVIGATKFMHGAWIVFLAVPILIVLMLKIKRHYTKVAEQLSLSPDEVEIECSNYVVSKKHVIVPIDTLNKASLRALHYAMELSDVHSVIAFHVAVDEERSHKVLQKWDEFKFGIPLVIKQSPYRDVVGPLLNYIHSEEHESGPNDTITIIMPQFVVHDWWENLLHNQTAFFIRYRLLLDPRIALISVPYVLNS